MKKEKTLTLEDYIRENARLQAIVDERARRTEAFTRLINRIQSFSDLSSILRVTVEEIGGLLDAAHFFVQVDIPPQLNAFFEYAGPGRAPLGELPQDFKAFGTIHHIWQKVPNSFLVVPIMLRHEVLGLIGAQVDPPRQWEPDDNSLILRTAGELAILLSNARLAIENQNRAQKLESQRTQLRALTAQHLTLFEEERRRVARELHDEAGQALVGIKLNLQILARKIPPELPDLRQEVDRLRIQVNQASQRLHRISQGLRPPTLDELGLASAIHRLASEFEQSSGVAVHLEVEDLSIRFPHPIEIACYRIVQEALTNVARHANASRVWIAISFERNEMCLTIRDDGSGFNPVRITQDSLGILGMQERAMMLEGHIDITTPIQGGTLLSLQIPLSEKEAQE